MSGPIIEVKNLSKKYSITHQRGGYIALRDVLTSIAKHPLGFLKSKVKETLGVEIKEEFWALKDVSFNVEQGEVIGIIGKNGAGKSTLLKILSGITPPTEGQAVIRGKIASLLEVGTGFHPELTGRENIFLNGAILGMTKKEIAKKFDEIVSFSGVEKFLDTPLKYYSSGMYVRLAFSVAAHMEPDILLVDEVLAVGDAEFQKKCLGKMEEVTKKQGRTILFVSHNINAVKELCHQCILLNDGRINAFGETDYVVQRYLGNQYMNAAIEYAENLAKDSQILKIIILNEFQKPQSQIPIDSNFYIRVEFKISKPIRQTAFSILFYSRGEKLLFSSDFDATGELKDYEPDDYAMTVSVPARLFNVGSYFFDVILHKPGIEGIDHKQNIPFEIIQSDKVKSIMIMKGNIIAPIATVLDIKTEKLTE